MPGESNAPGQALGVVLGPGTFLQVPPGQRVFSLVLKCPLMTLHPLKPPQPEQGCKGCEIEGEEWDFEMDATSSSDTFIPNSGLMQIRTKLFLKTPKCPWAWVWVCFQGKFLQTPRKLSVSCPCSLPWEVSAIQMPFDGTHGGIHPSLR